MATLYGNKFSPETSMTLSVEQERDSYKEKVEHMKILLKQLDQELHSQKIRKEGVETVSKLLQEAQREISVLQKSIKTKETQIRNLQSRLSAHGLSDSVVIAEGDVFIPGTSNQVLDNLVRENSRLRTLVRGASVDPEALAKLQQLLAEKQEEIEFLTQQVQTDSQKYAELENILSSSDNEKNVKIVQLQAIVRKMKDDFQTRDILCNSLAEESSVLKQQLHDVAVKCQQMALRLEKSDRSSKSESKTQKDLLVREQGGNTERIQKENNELKQKLDEVVVMNKRWQEYDSQRDSYVRHQQGIIRSLEEKLKDGGSGQYSQERFRKINQTIAEVQMRLRTAEEEKRQLQEELTERNNQLIQQSSEVQRLKAELESALQNGPVCRSDSEIMEALKAQIQICTEDFESERKDREKAQNKIAHLQSELETVKSEKNRLLQAALPQEGFRRTREMYNDFNIPRPDYGTHFDNELATRGPSHGQHLNVADFGIVTDSEPAGGEPTIDFMDDDDDEENIKSIQEKQNSNEKELHSAVSVKFPSLSDEEVDSGELVERGVTRDVTDRTSKKNETTVLTCPKCSREFMSDKHSELLDHIEVCCD